MMVAQKATATAVAKNGNEMTHLAIADLFIGHDPSENLIVMVDHPPIWITKALG